MCADRVSSASPPSRDYFRRLQNSICFERIHKSTHFTQWKYINSQTQNCVHCICIWYNTLNVHTIKYKLYISVRVNAKSVDLLLVATSVFVCVFMLTHLRHYIHVYTLYTSKHIHIRFNLWWLNIFRCRQALVHKVKKHTYIVKYNFIHLYIVYEWLNMNIYT